jgi:hypothetical protein
VRASKIASAIFFMMNSLLLGFTVSGIKPSSRPDIPVNAMPRKKLRFDCEAESIRWPYLRVSRAAEDGAKAKEISAWLNLLDRHSRSSSTDFLHFSAPFGFAQSRL